MEMLLNLKLTHDIICPMNKYEIMVLYFSELKGETLKKEHKLLSETIKSFDGEVDSVEDWGLKDLAYEMKKQTQANYYLVNMGLDATKVADLDLWLKRQNKTVLRHLITKVKIEDKPLKSKK